ncbi:hypothetical protein LNP74_28080 [Klebsiella pneumoniae subsp. pneumoniae]|nr:hypothetical protein [Klebsiella pneumoniae subsp. pneumoniae]
MITDVNNYGKVEWKPSGVLTGDRRSKYLCHRAASPWRGHPRLDIGPIDMRQSNNTVQSASKRCRARGAAVYSGSFRVLCAYRRLD